MLSVQEKSQHDCEQVWIKELNASEPLSTCREWATPCQKLRVMGRSDKSDGNLFTGQMAGVIQEARTLSGLDYGT